jgi:hypothetical protein
MLVKYLKNRGVVVAIGAGVCGWSACNTKLDKFDKALGVCIAAGRAFNGSKTHCPRWMEKDIGEMVARSFRHFKDSPT